MKLHALPTALVLCAALVMPVHAATSTSSNDGIMATIHGALAAADSDNVTLLNSYYTSNPEVVDVFAPFLWSGPDAAAAWRREVDRVNPTLHIAHLRVSMRSAPIIRVSRDEAYAVVPLRITYLLRGKPRIGHGLWTLTLRRIGSAWKITTATMSMVPSASG